MHDRGYDSAFTREEEMLVDLEAARMLEHVVGDDFFEEVYNNGMTEVFSKHPYSLVTDDPKNPRSLKPREWGYPRRTPNKKQRSTSVDISQAQEADGKKKGGRKANRNARAKARASAIKRIQSLLGERTPRSGPPMARARKRTQARAVAGQLRVDSFNSPRQMNLDKWKWTASNQGGVILEGSELVGNLVAPTGTVVGDVLMSQTLNPVSFSGSRLGQIAPMFTRYKYKVCQFEYKNASALTQSGQCAMYIDRDIEDNYTTGTGTGNIQQYKTAINHMDSEPFSVLKNSTCFLRKSADLSSYYVALDNTAEPRLSHQGKFWLFMGANPPASQTNFGMVYMHFVIELWEPAYDSTAVANSTFTSAGNPTWTALPKTTSNFFGDSIALLVDDLRLGYSPNNDTFSWQVAAGAEYMFAMIVYSAAFSAGTGSGPGGPAVSNGVLQSLPYILYNGNTNGFVVVIRVRATADGTIILDFSAGANAPLSAAANTNGKIVITQIDSLTSLAASWKEFLPFAKHAKKVMKEEFQTSIIGRHPISYIGEGLERARLAGMSSEERIFAMFDRLADLTERKITSEAEGGKAEQLIPPKKGVPKPVVDTSNTETYLPNPTKLSTYEQVELWKKEGRSAPCPVRVEGPTAYLAYGPGGPLSNESPETSDDESDTGYEWDDIRPMFRKSSTDLKLQLGLLPLTAKEKQWVMNLVEVLPCHCGRLKKCSRCGGLSPTTTPTLPRQEPALSEYWGRELGRGHILDISLNYGVLRSLLAYLKKRVKSFEMNHRLDKGEKLKEAAPCCGEIPIGEVLKKP